VFVLALLAESFFAGGVTSVASVLDSIFLATLSELSLIGPAIVVCCVLCVEWMKIGY
jgi:hypothetical protein